MSTDLIHTAERPKHFCLKAYDGCCAVNTNVRFHLLNRCVEAELMGDGGQMYLKQRW